MASGGWTAKAFLRSLGFKVLKWTLVFAALGAVRAWVTGEDVALTTVVGAMAGVVAGLLQQCYRWRAVVYQSRHDPPGPALNRATVSAAGMDRAPAMRRYRHHPLLMTMIAAFVLILGAMAVWGIFAPEVDVWSAVLLWGLALSCAGFGWAMWFTCTEVGPHGIRVRIPRRTRLITWPELAEVACERGAGGDTVILSTQDGQRIEAVGPFVTDIGMGRAGTVRMLAGIERHWAWAVSRT